MKKIHLDEILEKLQFGSIFGDTQTYYDKAKEELIEIPLENITMVEDITNELEEYDEEEILERLKVGGYGNFDQEEIKDAIDLKLNPENFVELINISDAEDYEMMKEFSTVIVDKKYSEQLLKEIEGKGAYKKFKGALSILELEGPWNEFKQLSLTQRAIFWCLKNGIEFTQ